VQTHTGSKIGLVSNKVQWGRVFNVSHPLGQAQIVGTQARMVTFGCQHKKVECPLIKVFLQLLLSSIGICKGCSRESIYKKIFEFYDVDLVV
jgi:hypothetical protein